MSQFINSSEAVLSPKCALLDIFSYLINEVTDNFAKLTIPTNYVTDNGEELIGKLFDNSKRRLRMYGSARELAENVKIYRNTPGSSRYSVAQEYRLCPYYTTPIIYKSLKDEEYIYKQDAYLLLQNMTLEAYRLEKPQVLRTLIAIFLRCQELANLKTLEFVKFDQKIFDGINEEIKEEIKKFKTEISDQRTWTFTELFDELKLLISIEWSESEARTFKESLGRYFREFREAPNFGNLLRSLYNNAEGILKLLAKIIDNRWEIFKSQKSRVTVRLFEDGDERFVIKAELFNQEGMDYKEIDDEFVDTLNWKEAIELVGGRDIEFILTPILRAKHKAVPIRRPFQTDFGILAVDAFFEMMHTFIIGAKLFQKAEEWEEIGELFDLFENIFKSQEKNLYFLKITSINKVSSSFMGNTSTIRDVRNVKKNGFTVKNLKNELEHLKLTSMFPEIQNNAESVYSEVDKRKKKEILRTCDLYDAIVQCQLVCILERRPNLKKFLHNQKGCSRVLGYTCDYCKVPESEFEEKVKDKKTLEDISTTESRYSDCELLNSSIAHLKLKHSIQEEKCKRTQKFLEEKIFRLEQELTRERKRTLELQNQMTMLDDDRRKMDEMKEREVKMMAENEVNQRMIQQLLDKLSSYSNPSSGSIRINSSSSSRLNSRKIEKCEICWKEAKKEDSIKCQKCRRPFHDKCATLWLKDYMNCPSCDEEFLKSSFF